MLSLGYLAHFILSMYLIFSQRQFWLLYSKHCLKLGTGRLLPLTISSFFDDTANTWCSTCWKLMLWYYLKQKISACILTSTGRILNAALRFFVFRCKNQTRSIFLRRSKTIVAFAFNVLWTWPHLAIDCFKENKWRPIPFEGDKKIYISDWLLVYKHGTWGVLRTLFSPFGSSEKVKEWENLPDAVVVVTGLSRYRGEKFWKHLSKL